MNRGALALRAVMGRRKLTQAAVRDKVGVSSGVVTRWVRGTRRPSARMAQALRKLFGIRAELWLEDVDESGAVEAA